MVGPSEIEAVNAALLMDRGVLPDAGGWSDQSATFVAAYPLLRREIEHWRAVHEKEASERARRQQRR